MIVDVRRDWAPLYTAFATAPPNSQVVARLFGEPPTAPLALIDDPQRPVSLRLFAETPCRWHGANVLLRARQIHLENLILVDAQRFDLTVRTELILRSISFLAENPNAASIKVKAIGRVRFARCSIEHFYANSEHHPAPLQFFATSPKQFKWIRISRFVHGITGPMVYISGRGRLEFLDGVTALDHARPIVVSDNPSTSVVFDEVWGFIGRSAEIVRSPGSGRYPERYAIRRHPIIDDREGLSRALTFHADRLLPVDPAWWGERLASRAD